MTIEMFSLFVYVTIGAMANLAEQQKNAPASRSAPRPRARGWPRVSWRCSSFSSRCNVPAAPSGSAGPAPPRAAVEVSTAGTANITS